ncbi:hypothetical protein LTR56_023211 [Elasticomyces elasticus]|nr:hypothetical protein LTR56_023211 [Elasticomyces elasticus]KAK3626333.1 hypothetical protein LTR22_023200 [Elasticomyces elasticus]KAK4915958.1 hypothetical protein LTR49_015993 [Elasticomyces elasticus]KAK5754017.1 hypothetical protein LTS12_015871 [Elasticomyces elasticus]
MAPTLLMISSVTWLFRKSLCAYPINETVVTLGYSTELVMVIKLRRRRPLVEEGDGYLASANRQTLTSNFERGSTGGRAQFIDGPELLD